MTSPTSWRDTLQSGLGTSYRIRQELGGGGMSATYVAEEVALGRSVVIKALSPELASGLNTERFQREIQLAARLQHAFIVPLLAAGVTDGHPWYTMPLVQGESLRARIAREGALTPGATARILRDVAEAISYAHAQGVVHRDIKPDNILLSGAHALVTDFGVAKALAASTGESVATATGVAIGTPSYMAPEQAAGDPSGDHRIDLYALGATAYEMLTGRAMFGQRSPAQMLMAHAVEDPEPLAKTAPGVPADLATLVHQLLAKHPNDRPAHAQDVADALAAMLTRWTSGEMPPTAARVTLARALGFWAALSASATLAAWLGVRWLPIPEWTLPAAIIAALAGLPAIALSVWLHRPAKPMQTLPSVASSTTVGKLEAIVRPHFTWRRTRMAGFAAMGAVLLLVTGWAVARALGIGPAATLRSQGVVTAQDRVFVADFDPPPGDSSLGAVVTDLMRAELGRSESIRYVTAQQRTGTLRAMGRPVGERIGSADAREVAQRANAKVYLAGNVTPLGTGYLLLANIIESATGNELARFRQSASSPDDLIRAVDRMGREVRDRLGASLREVRAAAPLYWAITPSLEAARLHSEALIRSAAGDHSAALRLLERAVEVDTGFVMAYRRMASFYANAGAAERSAWAAERAFRHREKLPAPIQRLVEGTWYSSPAGYEADSAIATYASSLEEFGPSGVALNNLALLYRRRRDFDRSAATYREGVKTDTTSFFAPFNLPAALVNAGRLEEARAYVAGDLRRWSRGNAEWRITTVRLALSEMRHDTAERQMFALLADTVRLTSTQRFTAERVLAGVRRIHGQTTEAMRGYRRAADADPASDMADGVPRSVLERVEMLAWELERPAEARRVLDSLAAAYPPPDNAGALGYPWLTLSSLHALAGDTTRARSHLAAFERMATPNMKAYSAVALYTARGLLALLERRHSDAIAEFRRADVGECVACGIGRLAHAYDAAGQSDSAVALYERFIATPQYSRSFVDARYLPLAYRRLGELHEARGDAGRARDNYARFVDLWRNADPALQPQVAQARRRLAALRPPG